MRFVALITFVFKMNTWRIRKNANFIKKTSGLSLLLSVFHCKYALKLDIFIFSSYVVQHFPFRSLV